ncbi:MAG: phage tail protein [Pseudomonadales bacterium]|jgi:hypothetical protein|nr:phage tail protein [Pseudomonadales bacterium]
MSELGLLPNKSKPHDLGYLTADTVDIAIEIDLTERALVRPRAAAEPGALEIIHPPEPLAAGWVQKPERWTLYMRGYVEPLAEWDFDPRPVT